MPRFLSHQAVGIPLMIFYCLGHLMACPDVCLCPASANQVTCTNVELTDIPQILSHAVSNIDLSNNLIRELSTNYLGYLRSVTNLKLKNNQIETIHDGAFQTMLSLQILDLSGNKLKTLTRYTFTGAHLTLTSLDLSNNKIAMLDAAFVEMKQLSRLDLRNNNIESITQFTFRDLKRLRYLLLAENSIHEIDIRSFRNLEKLMYIVLKGNPVGDVNHFQFNSAFVSYVDLSECGLTRVPRGLPNSIRYLQLRRNNMTTIQKHSFQDCPFVTILVLDENGITEIQENAFGHMSYLQQLWLNNNKLRHLPKPLPSSLQRLLMDTNKVELFEPLFPADSQLQTLSLMGNDITSINHDTFYNLSKLKTIDLSNNQIRQVYSNTFVASAQLESAALSKNPLQYVQSQAFQGLTSLRALSLAYIGTRVLMHEDVFDDLISLTKIDLDASPSLIKTVLSSGRLLSSLVSIQDLSLQSADLTHLRQDFPQIFPHISVLHISSSRWHCDTSMIWFRDWLKEGSVQVINKENQKCFSPRVLYDQSILSLKDLDFVVATNSPRGNNFITMLTTFMPFDKSLSPTLASKSTDFRASTLLTVTKTTALTMTAKGNYEEQLEEDTFNINLQDLYTDEELGESEERYPGFLSQGTTQKSSIKKLRGWKIENLGKTSTTQILGKLPTKLLPDSDKSIYNISDHKKDDLDKKTIAPLPVSLTTPNHYARSDETGGGSNNTFIIVIATTLSTLIIAAIIITLIVYLCFKQAHQNGKRPGENGGVLYKNGGITHQNRNDMLYFMPGSIRNDSATDSLTTTTSREGMSLIPGRDINHEGPHRVYKWEDF